MTLEERVVQLEKTLEVIGNSLGIAQAALIGVITLLREMDERTAILRNGMPISAGKN